MIFQGLLFLLFVGGCLSSGIMQPYIPEEAIHPKKEFGDWKNVDGVCIFVKKIPGGGGDPTVQQYACTNETFQVDSFDTEPYSSLILEHLVEKFEQDHKSCDSIVHTTFKSSLITELKDKHTADFVFPFVAYTDSPKVHRHFFLPLLHTPGAFYVARRKSMPVSALVSKCVQLWPLVAIVLAMSILSG